MHAGEAFLKSGVMMNGSSALTLGLPAEHPLCADDGGGLTLHLGERFTVVVRLIAARVGRKGAYDPSVREAYPPTCPGGRRPHQSRWTPRSGSGVGM